MLAARYNNTQAKGSLATGKDSVGARVLGANLLSDRLDRAVGRRLSTKVELSAARLDLEEVNGGCAAGGDGAEVALSEGAGNERREDSNRLHFDKIIQRNVKMGVRANVDGKKCKGFWSKALERCWMMANSLCGPVPPLYRCASGIPCLEGQKIPGP